MKTANLLFSILPFVLLSLFPTAEAHGIIGIVIIDGKVYEGPTAGGDPLPQSPIRQISDPSPVKGADNQFLACGPDAKPAPIVAAANPGSSISVLWQDNDRENWPHNTGSFHIFPSL